MTNERQEAMQGEEEDADNKQVLQLREWINNLAAPANKRTITQNETDPHNRQTYFMNFYCLQTSTLSVLLLANKTLIYIFIKKW